jgi:hypothetical protein
LKTLLFENFDTKEIESANERERDIHREGEKTKYFGKRKREDKEKSKTQIVCLLIICFNQHQMYFKISFIFFIIHAYW